MGHLDVVKALEKRAKDNFDGKDYPLAFEDRPFAATPQNEIFVRHSIIIGEGEHKGLGVGDYRYPGIQYLAIFFKPGGGNASVYKQADAIIAHYTDLILNDGVVKVVFGVASTIKLPPDERGFSQVQVVCPFYFDSRS